MAGKKNLMTREGLKALEDELNDLKLKKRSSTENQGSKRAGRLVREC